MAKQGVLSFHQTKFMQPILDGMDKVKSQLEYVKVDITPFAKMLAGILGTPAAAQQAWGRNRPTRGSRNTKTGAQGYKALADAGIPPTKQILSALADIACAHALHLANCRCGRCKCHQGRPRALGQIGSIRRSAEAHHQSHLCRRKSHLQLGHCGRRRESHTKDVLDYFVKDLGKMKGIEDASKARTDDQRLQPYHYPAPARSFESDLHRQLRHGTQGRTQCAAYVQLALTPKGGGGETIEALKQPNSAFTRLMRDIKAHRNGVAVFQVMPAIRN